MEHSYNELISNRIFIGSADDASKAVALEKVNQVFDVRVNGRQEAVEYLYTHSPILENQEAATIKVGAEKIATSYQAGEKIYIHCGSGTGRAAVMAAATLLEIGAASTVEAAIEQVKHARPGAKFQPKMEAALKELYK